MAVVLDTISSKKDVITEEDIMRWQDYSVTCIDLPGKGIKYNTAALIGAFAMRCYRLRVLKLSGNCAGDEGANSLAEALPLIANRGLTHLDLSSNELTSVGAVKIAKKYFAVEADSSSDARAKFRAAHDRAAERLQMGSPDMVGAPYADGRHAIDSDRNLERLLDLSCNELGDDGVHVVADEVKNSSSGVALRIRSVRCTQYGVEALRSCRNVLVELDISGNPIGANGVVAICGILSGAPRWRTLMMSQIQTHERREFNQQDQGRMALQRCLKDALQLRELSFGGNGLDDVACAQLVEHLLLPKGGKHGLESFSLASSACCIDTTRAFSRVLQEGAVLRGGGAGLRSIELPNNNLNNECAAVLAEGIAISTTISRVNLANNRLESSGVAHISDGICRQLSKSYPPEFDEPCCVTELDLSGNRIGDESSSALVMATTANAQGREPRRFKTPWGIEKLHLNRVKMGETGRMTLGTAVATRAALTRSAAELLATSKDEEWLNWLRSHRVRMPSGLHVFGIVIPEDRLACECRDEAEARLRERWPDPVTIPADEAAGEPRRGRPGIPPAVAAESTLASPVVPPSASETAKADHSTKQSQATSPSRFACGAGNRSSPSRARAPPVGETNGAVSEEPPPQLVAAPVETAQQAGGHSAWYYLPKFTGHWNFTTLFNGGEKAPAASGGHGALEGQSLRSSKSSPAVGPGRARAHALGTQETVQGFGPASLGNHGSCRNGGCRSASHSSGGAGGLGAGFRARGGHRSLDGGDVAAVGPGAGWAPSTGSRSSPRRQGAAGAPHAGSWQRGSEGWSCRAAAPAGACVAYAGSLDGDGGGGHGAGGGPDVGGGRPGPRGSGPGVGCGVHVNVGAAHGTGDGSGVYANGDAHGTHGLGVGAVPRGGLGLGAGGCGSIAGGPDGSAGGGDGGGGAGGGALCGGGFRLGNGRFVPGGGFGHGSGGGDGGGGFGDGTNASVAHGLGGGLGSVAGGVGGGGSVGGGVSGDTGNLNGRGKAPCADVGGRGGGTTGGRSAGGGSGRGDVGGGIGEAAGDSGGGLGIAGLAVDAGGAGIGKGGAKAAGGKGKGPGNPLPAGKASPKNAGKGPPPPSPKGAGKGPPPAKNGGKGPPPRGKGKTTGKGPAAPAKAKGGTTPALSAKGGGTPKSKETNMSKFGETPLGRRIHFAGTAYDDVNDQCVFGQLDSSNFAFDPEMLKAMFTKDSEESKGGNGRKKSIARKPQGIALLDAGRAQNMAIVIGKLKVSTEELCQCLQELAFYDPRLSPDDLELLLTVIPNPDETKKLLEHRDRVDELRDIEQRVMPLCNLSRSVVRIKLFKFALSHEALYDNLLKRCTAMLCASGQAQNSKELRELLGMVLKVGNFINHGVDEDAIVLKGFAIESLNQLATFKTGAVSTLHFLCLTARASDPNFAQALKDGLAYVREVSREKTSLLKQQVEAFHMEAEFVGRECANEAKEKDSEREARMTALVELVEKEDKELRDELDRALKGGADVQKFFSVSEKASKQVPPCEDLFAHISSFVDAFLSTWAEIDKNPGRWQHFSVGSTRVSRRVSMPAASTRLLRSSTDGDLAGGESAETLMTDRVSCPPLGSLQEEPHEPRLEENATAEADAAGVGRKVDGAVAPCPKEGPPEPTEAAGTGEAKPQPKRKQQERCKTSPVGFTVAGVQQPKRSVAFASQASATAPATTPDVVASASASTSQLVPSSVEASAAPLLSRAGSEPAALLPIALTELADSATAPCAPPGPTTPHARSDARVSAVDTPPHASALPGLVASASASPWAQACTEARSLEERRASAAAAASAAVATATAAAIARLASARAAASAAVAAAVRVALMKSPQLEVEAEWLQDFYCKSSLSTFSGADTTPGCEWKEPRPTLAPGLRGLFRSVSSVADSLATFSLVDEDEDDDDCARSACSLEEEYGGLGRREFGASRFSLEDGVSASSAGDESERLSVDYEALNDGALALSIARDLDSLHTPSDSGPPSPKVQALGSIRETVPPDVLAAAMALDFHDDHDEGDLL